MVLHADYPRKITEFHFLKNFLRQCLRQPDHWANSLIMVLKEVMIPVPAAQLFPRLARVIIFRLLRAMNPFLRCHLPFRCWREWVIYPTIWKRQ